MGQGLQEWPGEVTSFLMTVRQDYGIAAEVRLLRDLRRLAEERHRLRDINKPLDSGLFELITTYRKLEFRCIYAFHHPEIVVLLCFVKKSRKTPPKLLEEARKRNLHVLRKEVTLGNATLH